MDFALKCTTFQILTSCCSKPFLYCGTKKKILWRCVFDNASKISVVQHTTLNSKISSFVLHRWKFPFNWINSYIKYKPEMFSGGWGFAGWGFHFVRWHLNTDRSLMILKQSWREIFCMTFRTLMRFNNIAGKFCQAFFPTQATLYSPV